MSSRNRKPKRAKRLPAIVPRFLKGVVTIGAIPTLVGACDKGRPAVQPVVAYYSQPVVAAYVGPPAPPPAVADAGVDAPGVVPTQPVVAAYVPAVVAAYIPREQTPQVPKNKPTPKSKKQKSTKPADPSPAVAAPVQPPPPVVAAYVPRNEPTPTPKSKKP